MQETPLHVSLSGSWRGAYRYADHPGLEAVPFNAHLVEADGKLAGSIDEPNTYGDIRVARLTATVAGARHGGDLFFAKRMDGPGGADHTIHYNGSVNETLTHIEGAWITHGVKGTFFMERTEAT